MLYCVCLLFHELPCLGTISVKQDEDLLGKSVQMAVTARLHKEVDRSFW